MNYVRDMLSTDKYIANLWKSFEGRKHVSVQTAAEITLHLFAFLFYATILISSIYTMNIAAIACWQGTIILSLSSVFAAVHVLLSWWLKPPKNGTTTSVSSDSTKTGSPENSN
jgi:hypothetical protein